MFHLIFNLNQQLNLEKIFNDLEINENGTYHVNATKIKPYHFEYISTTKSEKYIFKNNSLIFSKITIETKYLTQNINVTIHFTGETIIICKDISNYENILSHILKIVQLKEFTISNIKCHKIFYNTTTKKSEYETIMLNPFSIY
ncbi:hypothetical protein QJ850_gp888 [Acanthamoeba polyphaga mimivirus]|uniref:Uncharacterized protein n=1 Tax=Acanthamoeba polyphaga mimivirus Kroon TaxID=3069720 RepID=A0A0G2Y9L0_9VIRU|nr:hypothetical protein QJ850_gp888 [Acanthamoeba polyphaga mimivirus]AKI79811.1 hypothetical protein [Acanthamoeba polyphaga mimivirus Kroon]